MPPFGQGDIWRGLRLAVCQIAPLSGGTPALSRTKSPLVTASLDMGLDPSSAGTEADDLRWPEVIIQDRRCRTKFPNISPRPKRAPERHRMLPAMCSESGSFWL